MNSHFTTPTSNLYNIVQPQAQAVAETLTDINFHTNLTKAQRRMLGESEAARVKRLAKNAERMRQKRASETFDEYKLRLAKNAESNRKRRQNETETERSLRHMRNAMRQRLRRAMETPEQKEIRKARLAQRMREFLLPFLVAQSKGRDYRNVVTTIAEDSIILNLSSKIDRTDEMI
ncbi:uncharacterized protein C05D11.13-like isoform X2 [Wyeomyia smithii]|uniref:uncharacterized protein C05D11.13-like isoform X2 n=1 Tax=Wyeomyia smithii TaxID=174621 RepID=UPI00246804E2|nr:uncharacterized protein C05D11.13-like isoform X2 [Wyeomyia smithii]